MPQVYHSSLEGRGSNKDEAFKIKRNRTKKNKIQNAQKNNNEKSLPRVIQRVRSELEDLKSLGGRSRGGFETLCLKKPLTSLKIRL